MLCKRPTSGLVAAPSPHAASVAPWRDAPPPLISPRHGLQDAPLLWIAAEAFDAPLPEGWSEHFDWDGKVYFYNRNQDLVVRDHPLDDFYRELFKVWWPFAPRLGPGEDRAA